MSTNRKKKTRIRRWKDRTCQLTCICWDFCVYAVCMASGLVRACRVMWPWWHMCKKKRHHSYDNVQINHVCKVDIKSDRKKRRAFLMSTQGTKKGSLCQEQDRMDCPGAPLEFDRWLSRTDPQMTTSGYVLNTYGLQLHKQICSSTHMTFGKTGETSPFNTDETVLPNGAYNPKSIGEPTAATKALQWQQSANANRNWLTIFPISLCFPNTMGNKNVCLSQFHQRDFRPQHNFLYGNNFKCLDRPFKHIQSVSQVTYIDFGPLSLADR